jgi:hypothetical protein
MNGAPTLHTTASGKHSMADSGKAGNVGGKRTPGRAGAGKLGDGLHMLVKPGNATTKTAKFANLHRPEGKVKVSVGPNQGAKATLAGGTAGGAASKAVQTGARVTAKGHSGIHKPFRPEPKVKRDGHDAIKPAVPGQHGWTKTAKVNGL